MFAATQGLDPGYTSLLSSFETALIWAAHHGEKNLLVMPFRLSSTATDANNTPTTTLRAGLILGKKDSDGLYYAYDPTATDGTQIPAGVLGSTIDMLGAANTAVAKTVPVITRGNIVVGALINSDANALRCLSQMGFIFDVPAGATGLHGPVGRQTKASDYTVTAADNGKEFIAITGAVNFTLPTIAVGLKYRFRQTTDNNLVVTGSSNIVADGNAGASTLTFSTGSHKIGSAVEVEAVNFGSTLKWMATNLGGTAMSVA